MIHAQHRPALRQSLAWLAALVLVLLLVLGAPTPHWARGIAGYEPLHTFLEVVAVVIAVMVFATGWSAHRRRHSLGAVLLGCGFLGVALLDLSHALSYAGMPDYVTPSGPEKAINFWLAARLLTALALLAKAWAPVEPVHDGRTRYAVLAGVLGLTAGVHVLVLFMPETLPRTFIAGQGLTPLKRAVEYALMGAFVAAAAGQWWRMRQAQPYPAPALFAAAATMAMSEFFFTRYADVTDLYNLMGHVYKLVAYGILYRVIFVESVERPFLDLAEAQARLRQTQQAVPDLLWLKDAQGVYLDCNPRFERLFGAPREQIIGKTDHDFVDRELADFFRANDQLAMAASGPCVNEEWLQFADGGYRGLFETVKTPVRDAEGHIVGVLGLARDITAARAALEAQRASEQRLQQAVQVAQIGIFDHDHGEETVHFSPRLCEIYGIAVGEPMTLEALAASLPADERARAQAAIERAHDPAGDGLLDIEHRIVRPDGQERVLAVRSQTLFEGDGAARHKVRTLGAVLDITARRRAEDAMREREQALIQISQGVMITDAQRRLTYVNPGFERLTGYTAAEVIGQAPSFLVGPGTSPVAIVRLREALRDVQPFRDEILNYRKDGRPFWVELDITPMHDEQGRLSGYVGSQRDVTERRQAELERLHLESQLRESQKMESIGTLAGGIAHDFNNILGAIRGNVALAQGELPPGHPAGASLEQIAKASARARDLVDHILAFSRRSPPLRVVQPLRPRVEDALAMLRSTLPARVTLEPKLDETPLWVDADGGQIEQVLVNLCTNGWHAMGDAPGVLTVGLEAATLDAARARQLGLAAPGRWAHLWVRDTGCGMDAATRERIFEPFFTTKAPGHGTGLGLAVVHGIVVAHQGAIAVDSAPGAGSNFHVYLPLVDAPGVVVAAPGEPESDTAPAGHGEHVLYVDDDEVMCLVVERLLERAGFRPTTCADARAALALLTQPGSVIDVLVTDFNMPGTSGLELARQVRTLRPGLPVVISSGFLSEELRRGAEVIGVKQLLHKQNTHEEIVPAVRRALADRGLSDRRV